MLKRPDFSLLLFVAVLVVLLQADTPLALQQQEALYKGKTGSLLLNPDERGLATGQDAITLTKHESERVPGAVVFFNSLLMSMANCLGVLPFLFVTHLSKNVIGIANSIACGVMLACSFDLMHEGEAFGSMFLLMGVLMGVICVSCSQAFLQKYENIRFESLEGADARKIMLVLGIMCAHAVGEGAGVGVSYSGRSGWSQGVLVTLAIGLHNIPEGVAISTVLISRGVPLRRTVLWNFVASFPQAIFALPAYLFVDKFRECLPFALGFAAGCMIWVVFSELLPDAFDNIAPSKAATVITVAAVWLEAARMTIKAIEEGSFTFLERDHVLLQPAAISLLSMCICVVVRTVIKHQVSFTNFSLGMGIGMQFVLSVVLLVRHLFWSPLSILSKLMWIAVGCGVTTIDWKAIANKIFMGTWKRRSEHTCHLPLIHKLSSNSSYALVHVFSDAVVVKLLCGLVGIGVLEGIKTGTAFQSSEFVPSHAFAPTIIRALLFGGMIGLWLLKLQRNATAANVLCVAVASIPCSIGLLMTALGLRMSAPMIQFSALIAGFLISNSVRLLMSKPLPLKAAEPSYHTPNRLTTISEGDVLHSEKHNRAEEVIMGDQLANSHFYQCLGVLFGIIIASGALALLTALCRWGMHCTSM